MLVRDVNQIKVTWEKERDAVQQIKDFIDSDICYDGRVLLLYGLRRTGKTTMLEQIVNFYRDNKKCAFYEVQDTDTMKDIELLLSAERKKGTSIVCLDEVTKARDFIIRSSSIPDVYAKYGMNVLVTGTDSLGLLFSRDRELMGRAAIVSTTHISFDEHCRIFGTNSIDDYICTGGLMRKGSEISEVHDYNSARRYLDGAVADNITNSIAKHYRKNALNSLTQEEMYSVVEKLAEDYSGYFNVSVMQDEMVYADIVFPLSRSYGKISDDKVDEMIENQDKVVQEFAAVINADKKLETMVTPDMAEELAYFMGYMDVVSEVTVFNYRERGGAWKKKHSDVEDYIVQPAIKYSHLKESERIIKNSDFFDGLTEDQQDFLAKKLREKIFGDMTEQIVVFDVSKSLDKDRFEVGKVHFTGKSNGIPSGEYDMIVHDYDTDSNWAFEVKHNSNVHTKQYRHLLRKDLEMAVQNHFGKRKGAAVLFNGDSFKDITGIYYFNISDFLRTVGQYKNMDRTFDVLSEGLAVKDVNELEKVAKQKREIAGCDLYNNSSVRIFTGLSDDGMPTEFIPDAPFREKADRKKRLEEAKQNGKTGDKPIDSGDNSGPGGGR